MSNKPNYADDQVAHKALLEAAEAYNDVLMNVSALGLLVHTEVDGASIYPKTWREVVT